MKYLYLSAISLFHTTLIKSSYNCSFFILMYNIVLYFTFLIMSCEKKPNSSHSTLPEAKRTECTNSGQWCEIPRKRKKKHVAQKRLKLCKENDIILEDQTRLQRPSIVKDEVLLEIIKQQPSTSTRIYYLPTPPFGLDMTQGQFLSRV